MPSAPLIAEIARLVGDPARASMLMALLDARALTASELAYAARITPQTASTHLAKLAEAGLLTPLRHGRHRYFRLASPKIVEMLGGIVAVAMENRPRYRPLSPQARALSAARLCYAHLAGRLGVAITDSLATRDLILCCDDAAEITAAGLRFFDAFGIDRAAISPPRHRFCQICIDWTERRPHVAGAIGAALTRRYFDLGWIERTKDSRAIVVGPAGQNGFLGTFGVEVPAEARKSGHG